MSEKWDLKKLSDQDLLKEMERLSASERKTYTRVIETLEEIENRKLDLKGGFPSLFDFCVQH